MKKNDSYIHIDMASSDNREGGIREEWTQLQRVDNYIKIKALELVRSIYDVIYYNSPHHSHNIEEWRSTSKVSCRIRLKIKTGGTCQTYT